MDGMYVPNRGDVVWMEFDPCVGHEQRGHRPALVLSTQEFNSKTHFAVVCPITNQVKGYPFEVAIPKGFDVKGVFLTDQVRSLDWQARKASFVCRLPHEVVERVLAYVEAIFS